MIAKNLNDTGRAGFTSESVKASAAAFESRALRGSLGICRNFKWRGGDPGVMALFPALLEAERLPLGTGVSDRWC